MVIFVLLKTGNYVIIKNNHTVMIDLCVTTIAAILVMCKNEQASCFNCLPDNKSFVCWNCKFFSKCLPKLIPHSCSVSSNVTRLTYWSSTVAVALSCQCRHCCICSTVLPAQQEQQPKSNDVQQHYQIKDLSLWATARAIQAALASAGLNTWNCNCLPGTL